MLHLGNVCIKRKSALQFSSQVGVFGLRANDHNHYLIESSLNNYNVFNCFQLE
jgi:hypothetical protein